MKGYKREFDSPYYVNNKKHYCIRCGSILAVDTISKAVKSSSPEAKDFDFMSYDVGLKGNIEFVWDEFKCKNCGFTVSIKNMKRIEKLTSRMEKRKNSENKYFRYLFEEDEEYVFSKDHFCPECDQTLKLDYSVTNYKDKETDISKPEYRRIDFFCSKCNVNYRLSEIKRLEETGKTRAPYIKDAMNAQIPTPILIIIFTTIAILIAIISVIK